MLCFNIVQATHSKYHFIRPAKWNHQNNTTFDGDAVFFYVCIRCASRKKNRERGQSEKIDSVKLIERLIESGIDAILIAIDTKNWNKTGKMEWISEHKGLERTEGVLIKLRNIFGQTAGLHLNWSMVANKNPFRNRKRKFNFSFFGRNDIFLQLLLLHAY